MTTDEPPPGAGEPPPRDPFGPSQPPPYHGPSRGDPYGGQGDAAGDPLAHMAPLASLGRRLLARIIDALVVGVPLSVLIAVAGGFRTTGGNNVSTGTTIIYSLVYFVYEGTMLSASGQTLGKRAMRIRVAMLENGAVPAGGPGWLRAGVYALPEIIPCVGFLFWLVNVLWCTWDRPYRQCLHDKVAKTVVVSATR